MGTLKIKRGNSVDRAAFTPAEGELVYDTGSKEVFVGDGATQGGIAVSVSTQNLEDLGNVQALSAQKDQILVYNGSQWAASNNPALDIRGNIYGDDSTLLVDAINGQIVGPVNTTTVVASSGIVGNLTGDTAGSHTGAVVGDVVGNVTGYVVGGLTGSVFSDNSTVLVDAIDGSLNGTDVTVTNAKADTVLTNTISPRQAGGTLISTTKPMKIQDQVDVQKTDDASRVVYERFTTGTVGLTDAVGRLVFVKNDNGTKTTISTISVTENQIVFIPQPGGVTTNTQHVRIYKNGKVGIGGNIAAEPDATLHVSGDAKVTGSMLMGNLTTTERDALTAANGMIIYNTTLNKFQGYENGAWANLI
tara:strand:+ start:6665 stop:7747 length:1083 start_codon:yes stop_codon:yes gene_type:complete